MPYIPTRADFADVIAENAKGGYIPTRADFGLPPETTGQKIMGYINPVVQKINDYGGQIAQGLEQGAAGIVNSPLGRLSAPGMQITQGVENKLPAFSSLYSDPMKGNYVDPNDTGARIAGNIAQYTPALAGMESGLGDAGMGAGLLKNIISGAGSGYLGTNTGQLGRLGGAIEGGIGGTLPSIAMGSKSFLKDLLSKSLDSRANNISGDLFGSIMNPGQLNSSNTMRNAAKGAIRNIYGNIVNNGQSKFQSVLNKIGQQGYKVDSDVPLWSQLKSSSESTSPTELNGKSIKLSQNTMDSMKDILGDPSTSVKAKDSIKLFLNNPNVNSLHFLQSDLFKIANGLSDDTAAEQNIKYGLGKLRNNIIKDIGDSLQRNNDFDLLSNYDEARQYWATRVQPYSENTLIRKIVNNKSTTNMFNDLGTQEEVDPKNPNKILSYQMIRNDIASDPDAAKTITGAMLSRGAGVSGATPTIDVKGLLKAYSQVPDTLKPMVENVTDGKLNDLNNSYNSQNSLLKLLRRSKKSIFHSAVGIGLGGAGFEGAHHLLSMLGGSE